jgi:hypothetical protein
MNFAPGFPPFAGACALSRAHAARRCLVVGRWRAAKSFSDTEIDS